MPTRRPLRSVSHSTLDVLASAASTSLTSLSPSVSSPRSTSISRGVWVTPIRTSMRLLLVDGFARHATGGPGQTGLDGLDVGSAVGDRRGSAVGDRRGAVHRAVG